MLVGIVVVRDRLRNNIYEIVLYLTVIGLVCWGTFKLGNLVDVIALALKPNENSFNNFSLSKALYIPAVQTGMTPRSHLVSSDIRSNTTTLPPATQIISTIPMGPSPEQFAVVPHCQSCAAKKR